MAKFHENIQMHPTPCQMQIINRLFPSVNKKDCAIRYEGGTHFNDGRDYDGWFCVSIYKKGNFLYRDGKLSRKNNYS